MHNDPRRDPSPKPLTPGPTTHAHEDDESKLAALDSLPKVSPASDEAAVKTGTDDTPSDEGRKFDRVFDRNPAGSSGSPQQIRRRNRKAIAMTIEDRLNNLESSCRRHRWINSALAAVVHV